jgi:dienelactone hydrolase
MNRVLAAFSAAGVVAAGAWPSAASVVPTPGQPLTVTVESGTLSLRAQLWKPAGAGSHPAVLFNHGSYTNAQTLTPSDAATLGSVFARHGYVFLFLFRQGIGLSKGQGTADGELMSRAAETEGVEGRNRVQMQLLEGEELTEVSAALAYLRARPFVDANRIALVGHSFGGSLSLLMAARDARIRAVVLFGAAAASWGRSPALRTKLLGAVAGTKAPVLIVHARNDYSIAPGQALAAEMQRLRKPHALKIYPRFGTSAAEGHNIVFRSVPTWETDVFAFLRAHP